MVGTLKTSDEPSIGTISTNQTHTKNQRMQWTDLQPISVLRCNQVIEHFSTL